MRHALPILVVASIAVPLVAEVQVPAIFSPHAVLQADRPLPVFGTGTPGEAVTVEFGDARGSTEVGADGRWLVDLPPQKPSATPRTLVVAGRNRIEIPDLLVGEVWLCSGQSNMEWPLVATAKSAEFIAAATDPLIRVFKVPYVVASDPKSDGPGRWTVSSPQTAGNFTAVGYHLARRLRSELNVPVGILDINWGGTRIEPWIPKKDARGDATLAAAIDAWDARVASFRTRSDAERKADAVARENIWRAEAARWLDAGLREDPGVLGRWMDGGSDEGWQNENLPGEWSFLDASLRGFDGTVWFRRNIRIPSAWAGKPLELRLGAIDDADRTYFAGTGVGATGVDWTSRRQYTVPASLVKGGPMTLAVACVDISGAGGLLGPAEEMWIAPTGAAASERIRLDGAWSWRRGGGVPKGNPPVRTEPDPTEPPPSHPSAIWNAMGAWVAPYAIRGATWYQGESNAGEAEAYRGHLTRLVAAWRSAFRDPQLPFGVVQLAAFMKENPDSPVEGGWANLRESQRLVAAEVPKVGLVVALDIGDADDIHPRDKDTVGQRLFLWSLADAYGREGTAEGPDFRAIEVDGGEIEIEFANADGLRTRDGKPPAGFAIAGKDGVFRWANARIDGDEVIVSHPEVPEPVAVRYAWQNNPAMANLVNGAGLPASSFRSDP
jgi:sialate O-acetylesterase